MRKLSSLTAGLLLLVTVTGCANHRRWGTCAVAGGLVGAALGGLGGGLGVDQVENHPDNGERAAGAGAGFAAGALLGTLIGHYVCDEVEKPPPPPPPVAAPPPPPPPAGTKLATVGDAYFDFDKAVIKPTDGRGVLDEVVRLMKDTPSMRVVVNGYTDSIGSVAYNLRLSERRARAVKNYLVQHGIDSSRIDTRGYGKSNPVASNETESGRAQNRRAEVVVE